MALIFLLIAFSFFQAVLADQNSSEHAEHVLNSVAYRTSPSIIGEREWKELQLDRLVTVLDRTKTSFGRWGLVTLLHPISNQRELEKRKKIITLLIDNPDVMTLFQKSLEQVRRTEKSLLAYWDKNDELDHNCEKFYFSSFGLNEFNKSSAALNISTGIEMFNAFKYLVASLALGGVTVEFARWLYGNEENFNVLQGLQAGLAMPLRQHSLYSHEVDEHSVSYNFKDYIKAFSERGTWYDKYLVLSKGYSLTGISYVPEDAQKLSIRFGSLGGVVGATVSTMLFDYQWGNAVLASSRRIVSMNRDLNQLQQRVVDVAQCMKSITDLHKLVSEGTEFGAYFHTDDNDVVDKFIEKLLNKRFLQKSHYLYSRGHVLVMHQNIKRMRRSMVPLLHSIALLDAYCSIAQLYKEHQGKDVTFSFAKFVDSPMPLIKYENTWLPLLPSDNAITNNLFFGDDYPGKFIITGPNGGGKSTILKTYGIAAVLAQSWCIVPARMAQQTLFTAIRTSLAPHEDVEKGLSTFMAEKKVMSELLDDIQQSDKKDNMLVLIDEPYKGTVDAESAKRIYQFGKDIAAYSQVLVGVATHVKKPIMLEHDTNGIFGNYHVKIWEKSFGIFERLFKLEKDPATWWFDDSEQRSRFIDWISAETVVSN